MQKWCSNGNSEAWALQYNQHLGRTLLVPVEEPKSILDELIKEAVMRIQPAAAAAAASPSISKDTQPKRSELLANQ